MKLLSVETSCDETALTIFNFASNQDIQLEKNSETSQEQPLEFEVLANHVLSQINLHRPFGGVFPNLAKREHARNIVRIFTECLKEARLYKEKKVEIKEEKIAEVKVLLERESEMFEELISLVTKIEKPDLAALAVTMGPGLAPALWVGINFAKALAILWSIPVYPINHMEGHIVSALVEKKEENQYTLKTFQTPALALLISGGHTEIITFSKLSQYQKLGKTLDDAVGEAFDKVARSLGLPYPGGPEISKIAKLSREQNLVIEKEEKLPRPMLHSLDLNFSFSGLKTAVIYKLKALQEKGLDENKIKNLIALDFENAVTEIFLKKLKLAIEQTQAKSLLVGGGVIANSYLRENLIALAKTEDVTLYLPEKFLTGDNAFMIGVVGILKILKKEVSTPIEQIKAESNFSVTEI